MDEKGRAEHKVDRYNDDGDTDDDDDSATYSPAVSFLVHLFHHFNERHISHLSCLARREAGRRRGEKALTVTTSRANKGRIASEMRGPPPAATMTATSVRQRTKD